MGIMDLIRRGDNVDEPFGELQNEMAEALDESLAKDTETEAAPKLEAAPAAEPSANSEIEAEPELEIEAVPVAPAIGQAPKPGAEPAAKAGIEAKAETAPRAAPQNGEAARRLTSHTQSRLAALESFDKLYRDAQQHLQQIDEKLTEVTTSQQLTRRFFNILNADIHRANELELANVGLAAEHKKLVEQLAEMSRKQQEREGVIEGLRQRETTLVHDNETLRTHLAAARLELVEAANAAALNETKLGEALKALSARTVESDRSARENEVLREKQVTLNLELDKSMKREAEALRRIDEMSTIHARDAVLHQELSVSLGRSEKEVGRLQMALEAAQTRQAEMAEAALIAQADHESAAERSAAELRGVRSEMQSLQSRLDVAGTELGEAASEIARLKAQLSDTLAEKQVADERLASTSRELEQDRFSLSAATASLSQLTLQQETGQIQLDIQRQECEELRQEISALNARIKELLPFERLYKVTKARQNESAAGDAGNSDAAALASDDVGDDDDAVAEGGDANGEGGDGNEEGDEAGRPRAMAETAGAAPVKRRNTSRRPTAPVRSRAV